MKLINILSPYLRIFFLCGQSCYLPANANPFLLIIKTVPTIVCAIKGWLISIALVWIVNFGPKRIGYDKSDGIITNIFITCEITKTITVLVQSIFFSYAIDDIIKIFTHLEHFFQNSLHYKIEYEQFRKMFLIKTVLLLVAYVQSLIPFYLVFISNEYQDLTTIFIKIIQLESVIALIHIIFYIDLLRFHLIHLNLAIQRDSIEQNLIFHKIAVVFRKYTREILLSTKYRNYKHVHFYLWNATQKINYFFGWSLTTVFLQTFVDCVFNAYWLYNTLNKASTVLTVIRKYTLTQ